MRENVILRAVPEAPNPSTSTVRKYAAVATARTKKPIADQRQSGAPVDRQASRHASEGQFIHEILDRSLQRGRSERPGPPVWHVGCSRLLRHS